MAEITRERLAYLRQESRPLESGEPSYVTVRLYPHELRALLDAADERDRLREAQWPPAGHGECQAPLGGGKCLWPHCPGNDDECPLL